MICVYLVTCYSPTTSWNMCLMAGATGFTFGIVFADLSQYRVSVLSPGQGGPDKSFAGAMKHVRTA